MQAVQSVRITVRQHSRSALVNFDQLPESQKVNTVLVTAAEVTNVACERGYELRSPMPGALIALLLAVWVGAIAIFVWVDLADKFLWVPVLLALAGVFSSILPLATAPNVALIANAATLVLFIVSLQVLTTKRRLSVAFVKAAPPTKAAR